MTAFTITPEMLKAHKKWLRGQNGGQRLIVSFDADLSGADLRGANLRGANLSRADLRGANLSGAREDFFSILNIVPAEVPGLLAKLQAGEIDGSVYEGECACLLGTIGKVRHCNYKQIEGLAPNADRPAERWFLALRPGHTPENNQVARITADWIGEWIQRNREKAL